MASYTDKIAALISGGADSMEDISNARERGRTKAVEQLNFALKFAELNRKREEDRFKRQKELIELNEKGYAVDAKGNIFKAKFDPFTGESIQEKQNKEDDRKLEFERKKTILEHEQKQNFSTQSAESEGFQQLQQNIAGRYEDGKFVQPSDEDIRKSVFKINQASLYKDLAPEVNRLITAKGKDMQAVNKELESMYSNDPIKLKAAKRLAIDSINFLDSEFDDSKKEDESKSAWGFLGNFFK